VLRKFGIWGHFGDINFEKIVDHFVWKAFLLKYILELHLKGFFFVVLTSVGVGWTAVCNV